MESRRTSSLFACALFCALATTSVTADDGEQPTRITDPQVLASLGFAADARNVYAFLDRLNQPVGAATESTKYFGGTASGFTVRTGQDFIPYNRAGLYSACDVLDDLYFVGPGDPRTRVDLDIPNGAQLQAVRWWAGDTDTQFDLLIQVVRLCLPNQGPGIPAVTVLASQSTLGSSGPQSGEMVIGSAVDTKTCTYSVRATFGTTGCSLALYKVRAQWLRQVSMPPPTARFLDVPTNHAFFRFVEALAASGITGGCSPNQYCPDSPVTRGQMAVFLATALGLNWGGL